MKPRNNKPFCPDCGRPKMRFETEKKALNFIKYNGNDILKHGQTIDQIRVYYCPSCCAYHITTKPYKASYDFNTDRLIKAYKQSTSAAKRIVYNNLNDRDDEVIREIQKQATEASVSTKKEIKDLITQYFAEHTQYKQSQQDRIRHKINLIIKNNKN